MTRAAAPAARGDGAAANYSIAGSAAGADLRRKCRSVQRLRQARHSQRAPHPRFLPSDDRRPIPSSAAAGDAAADAGGDAAGLPAQRQSLRAQLRLPRPPASRVRRATIRHSPRVPADRSARALRSRCRAVHHSRSGAAPFACRRQRPPALCLGTPTLASALDREKRSGATTVSGSGLSLDLTQPSHVLGRLAAVAAALGSSEPKP